MSTLYELTEKYRGLLEVADQVDQEAFETTLESLDDAIEDKAESYAIIDKELEAQEDKFAKEIKRLGERKKAISNNRKRLKEDLLNGMKMTGKERFKTELFSFWIQKNPARLVIKDEKLIPKKYYVKQDDKLDTVSLKKDATNEEVSGVTIEQSEGVRFR